MTHRFEILRPGDDLTLDVAITLLAALDRPAGPHLPCPNLPGQRLADAGGASPLSRLPAPLGPMRLMSDEARRLAAAVARKDSGERQ